MVAMSLKVLPETSYTIYHCFLMKHSILIISRFYLLAPLHAFLPLSLAFLSLFLLQLQPMDWLQKNRQFSLNPFFLGDSIHSLDSVTVWMQMMAPCFSSSDLSSENQRNIFSYLTSLVFPRHLKLSLPMYDSKSVFNLIPSFYMVSFSRWHQRNGFGT